MAFGGYSTAPGCRGWKKIKMLTSMMDRHGWHHLKINHDLFNTCWVSIFLVRNSHKNMSLIWRFNQKISGWWLLLIGFYTCSLPFSTTTKISDIPWSTLLETNSSHQKNGWLEDDRFPFGFRPIFRGYVGVSKNNGTLKSSIFNRVFTS